MNSENCLATDFNQPDPTTYKPNTEKEMIPSVIPGKEQIQTTEYFRPPPPYTPRATFVKAPQVPSNFAKHNPTPMNKLPYGPLSNLSNSTLGIPYLQNTDFGDNSTGNYKFLNQNKPHYSQSSFDLNSRSMFNNFSANSNSKPFSTPSLYSTLSSSNLALNTSKKFEATSNKFVPPFLPMNIETSPDDLDNWTTYVGPNPMTAPNKETTSPPTNSKKPHAKVKFSDTVTAFIVPEIKRPQRPPPPPSHVTDPQRELADSLPLCHPNEDYLKDFAPVRKDEETNDDQDSQQPKIKVVHFGVV